MPLSQVYAGGIYDIIYINQTAGPNFLLLKHGLIGAYRFKGKDGIIEFIKQAGCIQYDPIDVCGRSPELVLLSRTRVIKNRCFMICFIKNAG